MTARNGFIVRGQQPDVNIHFFCGDIIKSIRCFFVPGSGSSVSLPVIFFLQLKMDRGEIIPLIYLP